MPIVTREPIVDTQGNLIIENGISYGRRRIYTELEVTKDNIKEILNNAMAVHNQNVVEINNLINYYLGRQKILDREAIYSSKVNNKLVLNYAQSTVRDIVGYTFGKDIEYVQRKADLIEDVEELTSIMQYEDTPLIDITTATFCSICGIGYQCVLPSDDYNDETPEIGISADNLDPRNTFVVRSYGFKNPVVLACHYYKTNTKTVYTLYDRTFRTTIVNDEIIEHKPHGLNKIPIVEFENNHFLMGDFEPALTLIDAINKVASDSVNDIENFVQSLLVLINTTLGDTEEERSENKKNIKNNRILEIKSPQGLVADAKYITQQLDGGSTANLREYLEECLWKILGIPDRKTRGGGGGDTGDAVKLRDGWADIEVVARNKEKYFKKAKKHELSIILHLLKKIDKINENLNVKDIDIKFSRNKNDNLNTKAQSYSVLTSTQTLDPVDALEMVDITTNVTEVINRGKKYWDGVDKQLQQTQFNLEEEAPNEEKEVDKKENKEEETK